MRTARENVLIHGLIDWVSLASIHTHVLEDHPEAPLSEVQDRTLSLVPSLVSEGLIEVGELSRKRGGFAAWDTPLDESMRRIVDLYVRRFDDTLGWPWEVWLKLTEKAVQVARALEDTREDPPG